MLVELFRAGFLPSMEDAIQRMQTKGIYLSPQLIQAAISRSKEKS